MECVVCNVRSSVTYCGECEALLCEECGATCDECHKRVCPDHAHETRSGRILCFPCYGEYAARRHHHHGEETVPVPVAGEERRSRLSRTHKPVRPWLASLIMALIGAAMIGVLLIFPPLRWIDFGGTSGVMTAYVVVIIPFLAVAWAFLGLFTRITPDPKYLNLFGLAIASVTIGLAFFAVRPEGVTGLARPLTATEEEPDPRQNLSPDQLHEYRQDVLQQFSEENRPATREKPAIDLTTVVPAP